MKISIKTPNSISGIIWIMAITFIILFVLPGCRFTKRVQPKQNIFSKHSDLLAWKYKTGGRIYASPIIKGDTIFIGSLDSSFYALDAKTGLKYWEYKLLNEVRSTAAISKSLILLESGNVLYALNFEGKLIWKTVLFTNNLKNEIDPWDLFHSSPIINNENVYIGTENGLVLGFTVKDGKEIFRCQTKNKEIIRTTPVISENSIFFGDWSGVMYAYSLNSAEELWQYDTKKDTIYRWKNAIQTTPVIFENSIYFAGRSSRLYSINIETGNRNWIYESPTHQWLIGGIRIKDGLIYLGSSDQQLFQSFKLTTGELQWQTTVDSRIWVTPYIDNKEVYVIGNSFYVLNYKTGEIKSQVNFDKYNKDINMGDYIDKRANVHSSPVLYNNKVIFGSDDGYVYALDLSKL